MARAVWQAGVPEPLNFHIRLLGEQVGRLIAASANNDIHLNAQATRMRELEERVAAYDATRMRELEERVAAYETRIQALETRWGDVNRRMVEQEARQDLQETRLDDLALRMDELAARFLMRGRRLDSAVEVDPGAS